MPRSVILAGIDHKHMSTQQDRIHHPETAAERDAVAALFREYADWLRADICLYDFEQEMAQFPAPYVAPRGTLFLASRDGLPVGAVGVRPIGDGICEMKRLYVRPAGRGGGLGRKLAEATLDWARGAGYRVMRLDTIPKLAAARALYEDLGFTEIPPYNPNPPDQVLFFEKAL